MLVMILYGVFEMQKRIAFLACLFLYSYCYWEVETGPHSTKIEVVPAGAVLAVYLRRSSEAFK